VTALNSVRSRSSFNSDRVLMCSFLCDYQEEEGSVSHMGEYQETKLVSFFGFDNVANFTNTRSPIFSSLSPFLTDPVSERLERDSLFARTRLEGGVAGGAGVVEKAFLVVVVVEGNVDFLAGACDATLPTEGVGDAAREGGAV